MLEEAWHILKFEIEDPIAADHNVCHIKVSATTWAECDPSFTLCLAVVWKVQESLLALEDQCVECAVK